MYYEESSRLIERWQLQRDAIRRIDRFLAHAYVRGGSGFTELPLLVHHTALANEIVEPLLQAYENAGVTRRFHRLECSCGEQYGSDEDEECECGRLADDAEPVAACYRILRQPRQPVFDPQQQPQDPTVFISYRHMDTARLAADLYYALRSEGHRVFLDNGEIPPGAAAEEVFLRAASSAPSFVVLVSQHYFDSLYCRKELAHAARAMRRIIRINVEPVPPAPNDMAWVDTPNWLRERGNGTGLTPELEESVLRAVEIQSGQAPVADLRTDACNYLMEQMSPTELDALKNRLAWLRTHDFSYLTTKQRKIGAILQEVTPANLPSLCAALAP